MDTIKDLQNQPRSLMGKQWNTYFLNLIKITKRTENSRISKGKK